MARWTNLITRQESTVNRNSGGMVEWRGLVLHTAEGFYEGTISWQKNPTSNVSSHFVVGKQSGQWCQMMDDHDEAWTQRAGNGHWLSTENEGFGGSLGESLTGWQVEANAQLLAEAHRRFGVPLQIATDPNGRGLGHHSMGCNWPGGAWGHCDCPGDHIIAQKQSIVDRAKQIAGGDVSIPLEDQQSYKDLVARVLAIKNAEDAEGITLATITQKLDALTTAVTVLATQVAASQPVVLPPGDYPVTAILHVEQ